jgi:hypothetical protein
LYSPIVRRMRSGFERLAVGMQSLALTASEPLPSQDYPDSVHLVCFGDPRSSLAVVVAAALERLDLPQGAVR